MFFQQRKRGGRRAVEKDGPWEARKTKSRFPSPPTALGNPAKPAGFPLFPQPRLLLVSQTRSGILIVVDRKECLTPDTEGRSDRARPGWRHRSIHLPFLFPIPSEFLPPLDTCWMGGCPGVGGEGGRSAPVGQVKKSLSPWFKGVPHEGCRLLPDNAPNQYFCFQHGAIS